MVKPSGLPVFAACISLATLASAADWPYWRGPARNDIVAESSGWKGGNWPGDAVWKANVGAGSTSPLVVGRRLYTMGWFQNRDTVVCLDAATGKTLWQQSYACPEYGRKSTGDKGIYSGCTSTPEFDPATGLLYTLSTDGDLIAWDTQKNGERVWGINLHETFDVPQRPDVGGKRGGESRRDYGYTTSPLVHGDALIVEVGAKSGTVVAFDKRNGKQLWSSQCTDEAGHSGGPVPMEVEGIPCVAVLTLRNLVVIRTDKANAGRTVATHPWTTDFANNIPTPAVLGNNVLVTSAYNRYAICKLKITLAGASVEWEQPLASGVCSPIIHDGHVYWAWRGVHCLDWQTGREKWNGGDVGAAGSCVLTADSRLIVWANQGDLTLIETAEKSPEKYTELVRQRRLAGTDCWPHVVLCDGRLFLKDRAGNITCFEPASAKTPAARPVASTTPGSTPKPAPKPAVPKPSPPEPAIDLKSWPGEAPGLVLAWQRGFGRNAVAAADASQPRNVRKLVPRENAGFDDDGRLRFGDGAILVEGADDDLLAACKSSGELGIEVVLTSRSDRQAGPARIVSFSSDGYSRNFTLAQERDRLLLRLRTPRTGDNGMNPQTDLGPVPVDRPQHLIVTYRDGELAWYLNGEPAGQTSAVTGDFANWSPQHLLLGDEWDAGKTRNWSGVLERLALYSRFIGPREARQRFELAKKAKAVE